MWAIRDENGTLVGYSRCKNLGYQTEIDESSEEWANFVQNKETENTNIKIKSELNKIDVRSVRAMREFLVRKFPDEPEVIEFLKPQEDSAATERSKL